MRRFSLVTPLLLAALIGCNKPQTQTAQNPADQTQPADVGAAPNGDPANGNLASAPESAAPPEAAPGDYGADYDQQDASYQQPVQASEPPPPLPDYDQPPCPGDDYIWTPGYWAYSDAGYYWVPGAWVLAPYIGALWTPPWWGWDNGVYLWHPGYWAPHIGYYGGIDYGFGYTGRGYYGAYWDNGHLDYNRSVTNVNTAVVHNVYNYSVPSHGGSRVSYNGGRGGINARPTPQELAVVHDSRTPPVAAQLQHARQASTNRAQFAKASGAAKPAALAASRPLPTTYRAPAARPPAPAAAPARMAQRPAAQSPAPQNHERGPIQATRQAAPPEIQGPASRPVPQARPQAVPTAPPHPAPQARAERRPVPPPRPAPEARPAPPPRSAPEARPEARPAAPPRPAPSAHPAPPPRPAPKKEDRKEP